MSCLPRLCGTITGHRRNERFWTRAVHLDACRRHSQNASLRYSDEFSSRSNSQKGLLVVRIQSKLNGSFSVEYGDRNRGGVASDLGPEFRPYEFTGRIASISSLRLLPVFS